jgi:hypothetical protein
MPGASSNNQRYTMGDAGMSAFSVLFMQSPSFLDFQVPFDHWEHLFASMIDALQPAQPPPRRCAGKR